jgi:hypothetical protein
MGQSPSAKGDLRGAAERLERGIEKYGEGDLAGALVEFEAALKLYPASARGRQFVAWVKDVQAGKRSPNGKKADALDEDALRAVEDALEDEDKPAAASSEDKPKRKKKKPAASESQTGVEPPTTERRMDHDTAEQDRPPHSESPWDPVPLTPGGHDAPPELSRQPDRLAELQTSATKAAPPPSSPANVPTSVPNKGSAPTIMGMPALEPKLLTPQKKKRQKVAEDRPESVTREFKQQTPTGPNLRPLDVPELTEEQIQGLLALDSPLLPEGRTTPQIELDRIDGLDDSQEQRVIEMEAVPTPLPQPAPPSLRKNDTNPMGVRGMVEGNNEEFDPNQLTPTGIKPQGLKAVAPVDLDEDPYADLNLLPLEVAPDLAGPEDIDEGTGNPTNPFIRGAKLATYTSFGGGTEPKLEDMPPLPSLPGARAPEQPLSRAEAALQAGDVVAAVDACEAALAQAGGPDGALARDQQPLIERIYAAILIGPDRVPTHGPAVGDLEPRSAFLLSRLDGSMTVEDVLDVSGMPRLEAMRTLALLVRRGAVVIK